MTLGILFTIFVSWVTAAISIMQFFRYTRDRNNVVLHLVRPAFIFSFFWFVMGVVWYLIGVTDFFSWHRLSREAFVSALAFQALIGLDLLALWRYFIVRFMSLRYETALTVLYGALVAVFEWALFTYGFDERAPTFFARQLVLSYEVQLAFAALFFPALSLAVVDIIRVLLGRHTAEERRFVLLASFSLIALGVSGALEQFGTVADSLVPASRLFTLIASMSAYGATLYITGTRRDPKEVVI